MRDLDDDPFDENGVLRDGHVFKVPQRMLDNVQRSVAQHFQQQRPKNSAAFPRPNRGLLITDAWGGTAGLHRPGWRIESSGNIGDQLVRDGARDERQRAYDEYVAELENAWRNDCDDVLGVPDRRRDTLAMEDRRRAAYEQYDYDIRTAWRQG
jgi:hypothetical protein